MSGRPLRLDLEPLSFDVEPVNLGGAAVDWEAVWADVLAWEPPSLEPFLGPVDPIMLGPAAGPMLAPEFLTLWLSSLDIDQSRVDTGQKW